MKEFQAEGEERKPTPLRGRELLPCVYDELRSLAAARLARENPGQTLQPTALVHEAYLRLVGGDDQAKWENQGHFFAAAAEAMRRILVENARRKKTAKHGGDRVRVDSDAIFEIASEQSDFDILLLDQALSKLREVDAVKAELVSLRYFAGLTLDQAAKTLGISAATVDRYWAYAKVWLLREMDSLSS